jgi:hypothetical protein
MGLLAIMYRKSIGEAKTTKQNFAWGKDLTLELSCSLAEKSIELSSGEVQELLC